jgi:hypothetical protein
VLAELLLELLEPLEQAARAIGITAATAMPATRADFRCVIRSSWLVGIRAVAGP